MRATNPEYLRKTTGRLYWLRTGETGWIDLGNCTSHKVMPDAARLDHYKYDGGVKRCDMSLVNTLKPKRIYTFDEHAGDMQQLLSLAVAASEVTQAAAAGETTVIASAALVVGRSYDLGKLNVSNVEGENVTPTALVANVDYVLDAGSGMLTILSSAKFGSNWTFTFDCAEALTLNFTTFSRLLEQGSFRFVEKDQSETVPGTVETINGQVYVTGWSDGDPEKFSEYTVEVLETQ